MCLKKIWPILHFAPSTKTPIHRNISFISKKIVHYNYRHYTYTGKERFLQPGESAVLLICNTLSRNAKLHDCKIVTKDIRHNDVKGLLITNTGTNNYTLQCPNRASLYSLLKFPDVKVSFIKP